MFLPEALQCRCETILWALRMCPQNRCSVLDKFEKAVKCSFFSSTFVFCFPHGINTNFTNLFKNQYHIESKLLLWLTLRCYGSHSIIAVNAEMLALFKSKVNIISCL